MSALPHPTYVYRPMTEADLPAAHALSVQLKWPHRLEDWAMLQRVSDGFVVLDGERLIGSAFTCPQGDYATIGLVIVSNDYQGQGVGRRLMEKALAACGTRTPMLNATLAGAPLYESQDFVEFGRVQQHQGQIKVPTLPELSQGETCRPLQTNDHAALLALAKAASGLDRRDVLRDLQVEHAVGIERDGELRGFALLRPFGRGRCIGPVVAENINQAKHLIGVLLAQVPDAFVRIDIPVACGLSDWLEQAGLKNIDTVAQMALGTPPQSSRGVHPFALITQAIG
ncbi:MULTISPECIES: GNAT family N-acetyltransferase [unclassified Pseudomonas]|uniref:GNAT family N-acetyltransferase n=1 Tax=unclassified Pseudomonas TaxID=196821 RepID=UPI000C86A0C0|nr:MULTISPECIES: GNAT family N-acetyltransferase [unclassified Pseudomonas]PMV22736.1 GNAT family N-acetyltransferase [Pseudomonas sp. FW305-3-2-15-C-TSA2]PMV29399.1 GNAT family N-acetyltransferase [Pseudomonas sp. DP16D-L5]PMV39302.1 GNAT family N-acetyltransferase [Pseudomonas sp. FW305-3-2-15-A-LB2]PMV45612.1 GNAT family N-acetyltransferase [Pseudomonas sp. FW305-3-2-15-C-R2A1]PMV51945.1 GNAT family N-acetyltransferase [Pseudomonas sp. FW305-3-2-15-C-LB1]